MAQHFQKSTISCLNNIYNILYLEIVFFWGAVRHSQKNTVSCLNKYIIYNIPRNSVFLKEWYENQYFAALRKQNHSFRPRSRNLANTNEASPKGTGCMGIKRNEGEFEWQVKKN